MTKQEYAKQSREMVSAVGPWTIGSRAPLFDIPKDWNPFRPGRKHEEWNDGFDATNESLDAMHNIADEGRAKRVTSGRLLDSEPQTLE